MLPRKVVAAMGSAANSVIDHVLLRGSYAMRHPPRSEVGFVAAVSLGGIKGIAKGPPYDDIVIREDDGRPSSISVLHFILGSTSAG
jgi:hypothetical protein